MPFNVRCRVVAYAALILLTPLALEAQGSGAGVPAADSSATQSRPTIDPWPQRGWISVGLGGSSSPHHGLAGVAAGWYSVGPVAAGVRLGGAGQWFGEQRSDQAVLIGARTRGNMAFLVGGIGTAKVASSLTCDGPCTAPPPRPSTTEMAYAFEAHLNARTFFGIGGSMFGVLGPLSTRYNAFAFTIDFGWFGS
jgi:hypothetical protein